jgi:type III restriction enzyme
MGSLQDQVIETVRERVDRWRGFGLGRADEPYPDGPPRYEPVEKDDKPLTRTSLGLLHHWFRPEPHEVGRPPNEVAFKYWPHQRRLVETFIYLHEVRRIRRTDDLYRLAGMEPTSPQRDPWPKLGGQLATGSGKTKMMSLLLAWAHLNAMCEGDDALGIGRHAVLIAPGLFVRDRLLQDFMPAHRGASVFDGDPVVPPELAGFWSLKVYSPDTCPQRLDPEEGALVVTNFHQLLRTADAKEAASLSPEERQIVMLFEDDDPEKLETVQTPLIERFAESKGLFVLNDEAHHVWDEPGHARFEERAKAKARATSSDEAKAAMAWIRAIRRLNGSNEKAGRVGLQVDLSATLFEETGTTKQSKKPTVAQFKENELFRHTAVKYDLESAIRDGIVKRPILELVTARNKTTGAIEPSVNVAATNAWEKYKVLLATGIERWKKTRDQLLKEGDPRKPILFILCDDRVDARQVANFMTYGDASDGDLSGKPITGCPDPSGKGPPLFVEKGANGTKHSTVVQIHIGQKEEANEAEWDAIRQAVNAIDHDEIADPEGRLGEDGRPLLVANPCNVVVSVMMLKEGWDVRNVKVIVPLRPCDSRTLTEQTLGRGLRKMHPPVIEEDGRATLEPEELYVIEHPSFRAIVEQIKDLIEEKKSEDIKHELEYVPISPQPDPERRAARDVRLVRVESITQGARDWRPSFDVKALPELAPKLPWQEGIDETEIATRLKEALADAAKEGQQFTLKGEVSYRDFDHVIEAAYAIRLLRQELKAGFQHKTAVKSVVREFLERKTFALPAGVPLSFGRVDDPEQAKIALGNLARADVIGGVCAALREPLHRAIREATGRRAELSERRAADIVGFQAANKNVLEATLRSPFVRAAFANNEELRIGALINACEDVTGWVYNHRRVGYVIEYDWQGRTVKYYPDFVVRTKWGLVFHNVIVEVKGRLDDRDQRKALAGKEWAETLSAHDREPWHYVMLVENAQLKRTDVRDWESLSQHTMEDLVRRHESLPLIPQPGGASDHVKFVASASEAERFADALPVYDLRAWAEAFGKPETLEGSRWAKVPGRVLDPRMFVAKVPGRSMERGIPGGAIGLFRSFPPGTQLSSLALDRRRVVVQLPNGSDPELGQYTLRRWIVSRIEDAGQVQEIHLKPDNPSHATFKLDGKNTIRVIAEFLEVVG